MQTNDLKQETEFKSLLKWLFKNFILPDRNLKRKDLTMGSPMCEFHSKIYFKRLAGLWVKTQIAQSVGAMTMSPWLTDNRPTPNEHLAMIWGATIGQREDPKTGEPGASRLEISSGATRYAVSRSRRRYDKLIRHAGRVWSFGTNENNDRRCWMKLDQTREVGRPFTEMVDKSWSRGEVTLE